MRVSTNTMYDQGVQSMLKQQEALFKLQQQISVGKRIVTPSDDPVAAARAHEVSQAASINSQYAENRDKAKASLGLVESNLQGVTTIIQNVRSIAVAAGNPILSENDRRVMAVELRGRLEELLGLANSADSEGNFLFSGYQARVQPFVKNAGDVQYAGDQGQRLTQVTGSRQIAVSDTGSNIFERIMDGNGIFTTSASTSNAGTGIIGVGSVTDPTNLTGDSYEINFRVTQDPLTLKDIVTYDVMNTTTSSTISTGNTFVDGDMITFDGLQFDIKGKPADGDQFNVEPSSQQSIFKTIDNLINVLETTTNDQNGKTNLTNTLNTGMQNLDQSLDNVLSIRASVGVKLQEIDALQSIGEDNALQYDQTLARLQDLDYAKALSDFARQQGLLEAAQQSFIRISGLSLFNKL